MRMHAPRATHACRGTDPCLPPDGTSAATGRASVVRGPSQDDAAHEDCGQSPSGEPKNSTPSPAVDRRRPQDRVRCLRARFHSPETGRSDAAHTKDARDWHPSGAKGHSGAFFRCAPSCVTSLLLPAQRHACSSARKNMASACRSCAARSPSSANRARSACAAAPGAQPSSATAAAAATAWVAGHPAARQRNSSITPPVIRTSTST